MGSLKLAIHLEPHSLKDFMFLGPLILGSSQIVDTSCENLFLPISTGLLSWHLEKTQHFGLTVPKATKWRKSHAVEACEDIDART